MITFLTKEAELEPIKDTILNHLSRRNVEAEGLSGHLPWKPYHVEMAIHELLRDGRLVSFWTDSGAYQRHYYALPDNFDPELAVMQICAAPEVLEKLGEVNLTTREAVRQAKAKG